VGQMNGVTDEEHQIEIEGCESRTKSIFTNFMETEIEVDLATSCHSCCCSNLTNQIDCSGLNTNTIDQLLAAREVGLDRTEHVYLNGNSLDNLSHFQLMNVSDIVSVELKSNRIKTLELEELTYFDKIRKLDIEDNQIQFIKHAKRPIEYLEVLNLSKNLITRISNETFSGLIRLRGLNLSQNEISTLEPFALSKMTNLEVLNVRSNKLKRLESNCFVGIKKLTSLDLSSNELSTIPDGLFSDMENLVKLNLERNNIAFIGITGFSGLTSLTHLDLTGNWLANIHPDVFEPLPYPPGLKEQILLDENPLMCDCELRHLVSWISRTPFRVKNSKNLRCSFVAGKFYGGVRFKKIYTYIIYRLYYRLYGFNRKCQIYTHF
jgi:hypothetical protein